MVGLQLRVPLVTARRQRAGPRKARRPLDPPSVHRHLAHVRKKRERLECRPKAAPGKFSVRARAAQLTSLRSRALAGGHPAANRLRRARTKLVSDAKRHAAERFHTNAQALEV